MNFLSSLLKRLLDSARNGPSAGFRSNVLNQLGKHFGDVPAVKDLMAAMLTDDAVELRVVAADWSGAAGADVALGVIRDVLEFSSEEYDFWSKQIHQDVLVRALKVLGDLP